VTVSTAANAAPEDPMRGTPPACSRALRELVLIVALAAVFSVLSVLFHPRAPDYTHARLEDGALTPAQAAAMAAAEGRAILWVDARTEAEFAAEHVPGAVLLSEDDWEGGLLRFMEQWTGDEQIVIVYCDGAACAASKAVAERLRAELGVDPVFHLAGGWSAWREAQP